MMAPSYRDRIYEKYSSNFQDLSAFFDIEASRQWGKAYRRYLRGWTPARKDAAIVDIACGGGKLLHFFKEQGYSNLQGVDLSPEQVQLARQVLTAVHHENALDFPERNPGAFDLVAGFDVIEHFHKPEVLRFLDAAFAALKPGGRLVVQTPNAESPWGTLHRYNDFTHEVCFNPNALTRLMNLSGFRDIEARETGPAPWGHSLASTVRAAVWQLFRTVFKIWNLAEFGSVGSGVFTRVFLISAVKR
jgi:2-polyprenyl-3-methyl-5-hydroxy-6-metoxy-1,4-benzoquinol methylase